MAITTPYSLELTANENTKDAVAGAVVTVVAGHLKIFLGSAVDPGKRQQYVGSLRACYRKLITDDEKEGTTGDLVAYGDALSARDGNITIAADTLGVGAGDVAIVKSSSFAASGRTHKMTETFNQLINALLENSKDN